MIRTTEPFYSAAEQPCALPADISCRRMMMKKLFNKAQQLSLDYLESLNKRRVFPTPEAIQNLEQFKQALPEQGAAAEKVIEMLDEVGSPATVATAGGRYFGFVIGAALPASVAASWLAAAWDQNGATNILSPVSACLEQVCMSWLTDIFMLPKGTQGGLVSGASMANFTALAAARHAVLAKQGWDVESKGLFGAPPITVVISAEAHATVLKALSLLGLGRERVIQVPVDNQGRLRADALPELNSSTIVCIQAGNVNTGSFDPAEKICAAARKGEAWVHVDGAFGLWAAAAPKRAYLYSGVPEADSWATDAHKWLNVPYDSGIVLCRNPEHLKAAMSITAAYLTQGVQGEPYHYVPQLSRRSRGIEIWAALKSLGKKGLSDMIERNCRQAFLFSSGLQKAGLNILNDVVLNQVLVSCGDAETTQQIISAIQQEGTCWCGGTVWQGQPAIRISVSSWATTDTDVERSLAAIVRIAKNHK